MNHVMDSHFSPAHRRTIRRRLLAWFDRHARDLPWRSTRDPYCIWVSEIMLQQTQVATVAPYYERFVDAFPDVAALARADQREVLRLWEGLGYYRRARQLQRAAQQIVALHGGRFPRAAADVQALPGIGRYTAGAVLSIAFDDRQPILEANTIRLLSRWIAYRGDPARAAGQRRLWSLAEELLPRTNVGRFNQALMELGSKVCTPRSPDCGACPVADFCQANLGGLQDVVPVPKQKQQFEDVHHAAVVIRHGGRVLLRRCAEGQRWAGLWDFPRFEIDGEVGPALAAALAEKTHSLTGCRIQPGPLLATIKHGVTRFRITLQCYEAKLIGRKPRTQDDALVWSTLKQLANYPLNTTGRKISRLLAVRELLNP